MIAATSTQCSDGDEAKFRACVTLEADVNVRNAEGRTALFLAIWKDHANIEDLLLAQPHIDVNIKCEDNDLACSNSLSRTLTKPDLLVSTDSAVAGLLSSFASMDGRTKVGLFLLNHII